MTEPATSKGLSAGAWGAITAITVAVISGIVTVVTHTSKTPPPPLSADANGPPPVVWATNADAVAGTWAGTVEGDDHAPFQVEAVIAKGCAPNARCGTISVNSTPCDGLLYLQSIDRDDYEFRVGEFTTTSSKKCKPGSGDHLRPQPDGTVLYSTTYAPYAKGTLRKR